MAAGLLERHVIGDFRSRETRVGDGPVAELVAEVDERHQVEVIPPSIGTT